MRDLLGPGTWVGYCTNVHPGRTLQEVKDNLERYACRVREMVCPGEELGIGLWLSAAVARDLISRGPSEARRLRDWLGERQLVPFTMNGFPYGDFHDEVVKKRVYEPTWLEDTRVEYTRDLIEILDILLPNNVEGSISTLPLGWGAEFRRSRVWTRSGRMLAQVADHLRRLEDRSGRLIHINLEPEPGCGLNLVAELDEFLGNFLPQADRRYVRMCYDICHGAVMFEDTYSLELHRMLGLSIGKMQISSAIRCRRQSTPQASWSDAAKALAGFIEPRYLHQTMLDFGDQRSRLQKMFHGAHDPKQFRLFEDLPEAIGHLSDAREARVHFHVPIFAAELGVLGTTQHCIAEALKALEPSKDEIAHCDCLKRWPEQTRHFEIETYAWNVLPPEHRPKDLAEGIAQELIWFRDLVKREIAP